MAKSAVIKKKRIIAPLPETANPITLGRRPTLHCRKRNRAKRYRWRALGKAVREEETSLSFIKPYRGGRS